MTPLSGTKRREPRAQHHRVGAETTSAAVEVVRCRASDQVEAKPSTMFIRNAGSSLAMKKPFDRQGRTWGFPGHWPQSCPRNWFALQDEHVCSGRSQSKYRYGASRVTGLAARVVYGPPHDACPGKHSAGAPTTPENTWFQTPLDQAADAAVAHEETAAATRMMSGLGVGNEAAACKRGAGAVVHDVRLPP